MTDFTAQHVVRSAMISLNGSQEDVFPLFGPVREAEWAEGWAPQVLYSTRPDAAELGAVFLSATPGEADTVWLITQFDAEAGAIDYARVTPGLRVALLSIRCTPDGDKARTQVTVTYAYTALSEAGNDLLKAFSQDHYENQIMPSWERAINHYLETGKRLPHHA